MQQITRGDYLKDFITVYLDNRLKKDITELYDLLVFQCGRIQKTYTPAQVIKVSLDEQESQLLKNTNTAYLAGITKDGHKETFDGSITFDTRGEVVNYGPAANASVPASSTSAASCGCQGLNVVYSNCCQPAIKAYFSINYVPSKLSELQNDTDFIDSFDVERSVSIHNTSTEAHTYIQGLISDEASTRASQTEALEVSIAHETSVRAGETEALGVRIDEEVSVRASQTEALSGSIQAEATAREEAVSAAITTTEAYTDTHIAAATTAINTTIGDLSQLDTSVKSSVTNAINAEVATRLSADNNLQGQIDGLAAASDVTDIVGTYAELQAYDTQHLNNNDIIKVLADETHDDEPSYYRFNKTAGTFSYIGSESASYTKAQADAKFVTQTTTINGEALSQNITLTATEVGALPSTTTINDLTTTAQQNAINSTATTAKINQIATNTTNIASNTSDISTINGKIPTDASTTNKLVSAASLAASIADFANKDLNNLSTTGTQKLRSLNAYANNGELLTDADGLAFIKNYAHSTFDLSKFTVVGSPNITDGGIASELTSSSYIDKIINNTSNNSFKFVVSFITPSSLATGIKTLFINFLSGVTSNRCEVFINNGKLASSVDANGVFIAATATGSYQLSPSTKYYASLEFTGTSYKFSYSLDNNNWTQIWSVDNSTNVFQNAIRIGNNAGLNRAFDGSIDLKQFSVIVDGVEVFSGNKTGIDTIKPDDYTVVGTPTISADGILTTSTNNYVLTSSFNITNAEDFELVSPFFNFENQSLAFQQGLNWVDNNYLPSNDTCFYIQRRNLNGGMEAGIYTQNTGLWSSAVVTTNANTWYQIKFKYTYPNWNIYYRTLTSNWQQVNSSIITDTSKVTIQGTRPIAYKLQTNEGLQYGKADLNSFKIYVDGNLVYQPCLKIPYTESRTGSKVVNSIYRSRVNDMAEQFGYANYYTLLEEDTPHYTVVGSPTISSNFVASGFTNDNYLTASFNLDGSKTFDIDFKFKTPNSISANGIIFGYSGNPSFVFRVNSTKNVFCEFSITGSTRHYTSSTATLLDNTEYYGKISYNKTAVLFSVSTDKSNWIQLASLSNITDFTGVVSYTEGIGRSIGNVAYASPFEGSIDLKEFKIYVDNKLAYEAVTEPNFTLPQVELYGLIGQRTLRDSYRNGINYWELYSNRDLEQGGSCTSGVEVTFARPFADTNYVLSVPYSAKSNTAFTPTQTGDWIAKGKGIL